VTPIVDKMRKNRLRWFTHVMRRGDLVAIKVAMEINFEGNKRERGVTEEEMDE